MPVVGTVFSATGPGALGWSAWEEGPWHSPSLCPRPALCTDQVRRADWSPAPRVLLTFPWPNSFKQTWSRKMTKKKEKERKKEGFFRWKNKQENELDFEANSTCICREVGKEWGPDA